MQRQNSSAKTGLPAIREVRTNLGLSYPHLRNADRPPRPRPRPTLVPSGHEDISGNKRTPDKSHASINLAKQAISGPPPVSVTSGHGDIFGNRWSLDTLRASDILAN